MSVDALAWQEVSIPGSTPPVSLVRLHAGADRSFVVLVRFPDGWSRPGTGHYDAIEEVLFLDGAFSMSGRDYGPGDYAWFPASYSRTDSRSSGALALAWFSRPNRWTAEPSPQAREAAEDTVMARAQSPDRRPSPLGAGAGRLLRAGALRSSWILDQVSEAAVAPTTAELLSLDTLEWVRVPAGQPLPALAGPVWCRLLAPDAPDASDAS